jgi:hypothetical protein
MCPFTLHRIINIIALRIFGFYFYAVIMTAHAGTNIHGNEIRGLLRVSIGWIQKNPAGRIINRFSQVYSLLHCLPTWTLKLYYRTSSSSTLLFRLPFSMGLSQHGHLVSNQVAIVRISYLSAYSGNYDNILRHCMYFLQISYHSLIFFAEPMACHFCTILVRGILDSSQVLPGYFKAAPGALFYGGSMLLYSYPQSNSN